MTGNSYNVIQEWRTPLQMTIDEWHAVGLDVCEEAVRRSLRVAILCSSKYFQEVVHKLAIIPCTNLEKLLPI